MDGEDVLCVNVRRVGGIEGGAGNDEDGRVDEEGKGEEGEGHFENRILEAMLNGGEGGDVLHLFVGVGGGRGGAGGGGREEAMLGVVVAEAGLDDAGAKEEAVGHDGGAEDAAGLVETARVSGSAGAENAAVKRLDM